MMNMHSPQIAAIPFTQNQAGDVEAFIVAASSGSGPLPIEWADPDDPPPQWDEDADAQHFGMSDAELAKWGIILAEKDTLMVDTGDQLSADDIPYLGTTEPVRAPEVQARYDRAGMVASAKLVAHEAEAGIEVEEEAPALPPVVSLVTERAARDADGSYARPFPGKNLAAFTAALKALGLEFRYNSRSQGTEYLKDGEWLKLDDRYEDSTQEAVAARFWIKVERGARPLNFGRESWSRCLNAYMQTRSVDPFELYLESLPAWDQQDRLDWYLSDLFGCATDELGTWISRFLFLGSVQRTLEPACEMREMPVLIGEQNIGKSAVTRLILPQHIPGLHSDRLRWDSYAGQQVDATRGKVIVEVSEMAGRSRAQMGLIKSFISCIDDDGVRLPYRKNPDRCREDLLSLAPRTSTPICRTIQAASHGLSLSSASMETMSGLTWPNTARNFGPRCFTATEEVSVPTCPEI